MNLERIQYFWMGIAGVAALLDFSGSGLSMQKVIGELG